MSMQELRNKKAQLKTRYRIILGVSFFAKTLAFSLTPIVFETLYIGMVLILFDMIAYSTYALTARFMNEAEVAQQAAQNSLNTSPSVSQQTMLPPAYEETTIVYNISGQHQQGCPPPQYRTDNMFTDLSVNNNNTDLVLIGPVVASRSLPVSPNEDYTSEPPSYEEAIKNMS